MKRIATLCTIALLVATWASAQSGGAWTQLGGGTFTDHQDCSPAPFRCGGSQTINAQSGGVWDPNAQCLVLFGGGHWDSSYSGVDRYCLATETWENLFPTAPAIDPNVCNAVNVNGDPVSRHTYGMGTFVPAGNGRPHDLYWLYGGSPFCKGGTFQRDVWTFDLVDREWTFRGNNLPNSPAHGNAGFFPSCAYDRVTDAIYCIGAPSGWFTAWKWNLQTDTWSLILPRYAAAFSTTFSSAAVIVDAPGTQFHRRIVMANSGRLYNGAYPPAGYMPDLVAVNIDAPAIQHLIPTGSNIATVLSMAWPSAAGWNTPGLAWDQSRGKLIMWTGVSALVDPRAVYEIDPVTLVTTRYDPPTGPALNSNRGVYGRFVWTGSGFLEVHDANQPPYLFTFEEQ